MKFGIYDRRTNAIVGVEVRHSINRPITVVVEGSPAFAEVLPEDRMRDILAIIKRRLNDRRVPFESLLREVWAERFAQMYPAAPAMEAAE